MELATAEPAAAAPTGGESPQTQQPYPSASRPAGAAAAAAAPSPGTPVPPPPPASDTGADAGSDPPVNPRKRKKASRACDFCHVNHQPCDNGKPKCSVCTKHNKPCLYLRPTKRRGPQKGYRTALNTYKESAAAWGAVLAAIPGLDALVEGHLRAAAGRTIIASIKDSNQQDALIAKWQQSSVFRAFFGHNGPPPGLQTPVDSTSTAQLPEADDDDAADEQPPPVRPTPAARVPHHNHQHHQPPPPPSLGQPPSQPPSQRSQSVSSFVAVPEPKYLPSLGSPFQPRDFSDIVAKDAAQSATRASQTLASLGFAPDETIADFYTMGSNPEPIPEPHDPDFDPSLGSEAEQRAYYELLMGRAFPG